MTSDICIVGGGPGGLAAAIALTRAGREVTVLDCAVPPVDKACGEGLLPDSLNYLRQLGVAMPDGGGVIRGIRFLGRDCFVESDFQNGVGRGLRRVVLHETLVTRAQQMGIRMLWGVKNVSSERGRVLFRGGHIDTKLIVGADGHNSAVRREAGLAKAIREKRRYGFRRHYGLTPWSPYVEVYWNDGFQIYVTPVDAGQLCVALLSRDPHLRLEAALAKVPEVAQRLNGAQAVTPELGSLSLSRRLRRVHSDGYALLGDASGSVDAITGEGLCLAFQQAAALVEALEQGEMSWYQRRHNEIMARPLRMAALLLLLDRHAGFQRKALSALAQHPRVFDSLLAAHVGHKPMMDVVSWRLLSLGFEFLRA